MKSSKGITLTTVIITVVFLLIIVRLVVTISMDNYNNSKVIKFETSLRALQKKVDLMLEEGVSYNSIGNAVTGEEQERLENIIDENSNIVTRNANEESLRYFSPYDIEEVFELSGITDEIVVNFANRDIISLNGVEIEGTTYYTLYTLP